MRFEVDRATCAGYSLCVQHAPEVFEVDEFGYARATRGDVAPDLVADAERALDECPVGAIRRHADGVQSLLS